ncbi:MAG: hypothetical protein WC413_03350 [Candidatus Nanoarchaeia archaeon]
MKKEDRREEIQRLKRSPQYVTVDARFLGVTITIFILMLTVKSELLESNLIAGQLVLSIPFWIAALVSQSKIVDFESLRKYYTLNKISSGVALAFLYNTLGLLTVRYISLPIGLAFFSLYLAYELYTAFFHLEIRKPDRTIRDTMVLLILIFGGILPALGIINF